MLSLLFYGMIFSVQFPKVFERCFQKWVQSIVETVGAQVIPIDGKTLRGSYDREQKKSALHLVSAWASVHRLVLGQVKVSNKSNEITAIPALLELLDFAGCIITIDAMGTQTAIAAQIYNAKADYVLALTDNNQVKEYRLGYAYGTTTGRSLLKQIEECDARGMCLQATVFEWQQGSNGFEDAGYDLPNYLFYNNKEGWQFKTEGVFEDFNGDGLVDFSQATRWSDGRQDLKVYHNTGHGFEDAGYELPNYLFYNNKEATQEGVQAIQKTV